ncbi:MAG: M3 family oligoendopeptidase [Lachnospiraceae bacterium]
MKFSKMPYERVELQKVEEGFQNLLEKFGKAKSGEEQFAIHKEYYQFMNDIETNITLANIRHDIDTTDEFYDKENEYYDELYPVLNNYEVQYHKAMYESPYRPYLEEKIGKVAFKNIELSMKSFDEKLIPLMQEENALTSRYAKLLASAKIPFEGEIYNLSLMGKFTTSSNRETRKSAYQAMSGFFVSIQDQLDEIYDKLVKNRTRQAKELGYENFVELGYYRMGRNSYDKDMVARFRKQVKEYFVPFVEKLEKQRGERVGLAPSSFIDRGIYFKEGNPEPIGTPEEILAEGQKMYAELSAETKEFFDFMQENELFDVLGRKTKKQGGYMTYLPNYKSPFVFANFNGTSGDVDVITHECGHAFQGYLMKDDPIVEHGDITMETAEIHSMSMEYFTYGWMEKFFGDRAKDYKTMHLESSASFVPYGCMVDEFQHIVYENPELSPEERREEWMKLEKVYRPSLDYEGLAFYTTGGIWQRQAHIYESPFYYIDYCLATIGAMQFKIKMDENYEMAWKDYYKFAKMGASGFYTDMIKEVGLQSPFEDGCVKEVVEKIEAKSN